MQKDLSQNLIELETKILKINDNYKKLLDKYSDLEERYKEMKEKYEAERKGTQQLLEEQKKIKLISAISGNPEYNRLMKTHINRLIKEIDYCIIYLRNKGM